MKIIALIIILGVSLLIYSIWRIEVAQSVISKGKIVNPSQRKNAALLIIDLQKDLTTSKGKMTMDTLQTDAIIKELNKLLTIFDKTEFPIIYIQQEYEKQYLLNLLTRNALRRFSEGVALDEHLLQLKNGDKAYYLTKHIRDMFSNSELDKILEKHQVGHLYITGIDAAYCVSASIDAAINRMYRITVVENLIGTKKAQDLNLFMKKWRSKGCIIENTNEITF